MSTSNCYPKNDPNHSDRSNRTSPTGLHDFPNEDYNDHSQYNSYNAKDRLSVDTNQQYDYNDDYSIPPYHEQNYHQHNRPPENCQPENSSFFKQENESPPPPYPPLFRPPPTSYYSNCYPPHNIEFNSNLYRPPASFRSLNTNQMMWYEHQQQYYRPYPTTSSEWYGNNNNNDQQLISAIQFTNSSGREARNRAEKQRRDKLNGSIQDLATMVPHVAESPRRVDKTAILRYSAHGLRIRYVFGKSLETESNQSTTGISLTDTLMTLLDGFLLTLTCRGQIVLISSSVEQHLGHCQTDLFGQNILHITNPDDHQMLKQQLIPSDLDALFDIQSEDEHGEFPSRTEAEEDAIDQKLREDRRCFTLRLAKATPRSEPTQYEIVRIEGNFRRADSAPRGVKSTTFQSGLQLIRRARTKEETSIPLHSISGNDIVLICVARIIKPLKIEDKLLESNQYEYKTRHLIDGRIVQCDQRISIVAGYMTDEVNGLCPFTFMHQDDVRWVIVALRQMYDSKSSYGESCYRLLTRPGRFIYLRTRGYLDVEKSTNKVHSFVCINTLVSEEEGKRRCEEMKKKFSVIINTKIPDSSIDAPASDNAHQLEKAVMYLIHNLQHDVQYNQMVASDSENDDNFKESATITDVTETSPKTSTSTIDLVPPQTDSIKSSISKSVNVVNVTSAKCFRLNKAMNSPISEDPLYSPKGSPLSVTPPSYSSPMHSPPYIQSPQQISLECHKLSSPRTSSDQEKISPVSLKGVPSSSGANELLENNNLLMTVKDNLEINNIASMQKRSNQILSLPKNCTDSNNHLQPLKKKSNIVFKKENTAIINTSTLPTTKYPDHTLQCQPNLVLKRSLSDQPECNNLKRKRIDDEPSSSLENSSVSILTLNYHNNNRIIDTYCNNSIIESGEDCEMDLSSALTNSFVQINRSLSNIETAASEIRDQCILYPIPNSHNQLEEIIEEHHEQKEMLQNIQNEYEAHLQSVPSTESHQKEDLDDENGEQSVYQQKVRLKGR